METKNITWLERFKRECGIRRGIILHGNVADMIDLKGNGSWKSIPVALQDELKTRGYRYVVCWDRVSGISGVDSKTWQQLQTAAVTVSDSHKSGDDEEYNMGEVESNQNTDTGSREVSPMDFLAVVAAKMRTSQPDNVAFIVDWSQYLFGTANSLSEQERAMLSMIGKASRDADRANCKIHSFITTTLVI